MTGARSFSVSNGRFGSRLGLAPWVSNTSTKVAPSGGERTAAWVPIEPDAPPRFSIRIEVLRFRSSMGWARRAIRSVVPPGGNGTMMRTVFGGQSCAPAGSAWPSQPHRLAARTASTHHVLFIVVSGCFALRPRIHSAARRRSISMAPALIRGISSRPNSTASLSGSKPRIRNEFDAEHVVFQHRVGDLLRRADQARGVAERAGHPRDRHPQPLVMDVLVGEAHQPLAGVVDRPGGVLLAAPAFLAGHLRQDAMGLVPGRALGRGDDRAERDVEADRAARTPPPAGGSPRSARASMPAARRRSHRRRRASRPSPARRRRRRRRTAADAAAATAARRRTRPSPCRTRRRNRTAFRSPRQASSVRDIPTARR